MTPFSPARRVVDGLLCLSDHMVHWPLVLQKHQLRLLLLLIRVHPSLCVNALQPQPPLERREHPA